jgi:hypothetical protein
MGVNILPHVHRMNRIRICLNVVLTVDTSCGRSWLSARFIHGFTLTERDLRSVTIVPVQARVPFRQMGALGWADALLDPVHLVFFALMFCLGIFRVRVSRRIHWRGPSVPLAD